MSLRAAAVEVEIKFRIADAAALEARLAAAGARRSGPATLQCDLYLTHPQRDFAARDEALRIRSSGAACAITYKGPRDPDSRTKTRREIELDVGGNADDARLLFEHLGFRVLRSVRKTRQHWTCPWHGVEVACAIDELAGLGTFAELEIIAEPTTIAQARATLESLATALVLREPERRSYLELCLAAGPAAGS